MEQKIVVKLCMPDEKMRIKAMKIASTVGCGRIKSIAMEGNDREQLVVVGTDVDSVKLTKKLRRGMGFHCYGLPLACLLGKKDGGSANIVTVSLVEKKKEPEKEKPEPPCKCEHKIAVQQCYSCSAVPTMMYCEMPGDYNLCSIL